MRAHLVAATRVVCLLLLAVAAGGGSATVPPTGARAAAFVAVAADPRGGSPAGRADDGAVPMGAYVSPAGAPLQVVRPFEPPPSPYAAGHRGVDLAAAQGRLIVAAAPGVVTFAGLVAGRGVVVVAHPDGIRTEYEPLTPVVAVGDRVTRWQPLGRLTGRHAGCTLSCLHWGARRGDTYLDPLRLLRPLGPVRLLPWR